MVQDAQPVLDAMEISLNSIKADLQQENIAEDKLRAMLEDCSKPWNPNNQAKPVDHTPAMLKAVIPFLNASNLEPEITENTVGEIRSSLYVRALCRA